MRVQCTALLFLAASVLIVVVALGMSVSASQVAPLASTKASSQASSEESLPIAGGALDLPEHTGWPSRPWHFLAVAIGGFLLGVVGWLLLIWWALCTRKKESWRRKIEDAVRWESRKYHNEAIYRDFSFFIKITLAIAAGVGYLLCRGCPGLGPHDEGARVLIWLGGALQGVAGVVLALCVYFHQRSKLLVEREEVLDINGPKESGLCNALEWQETYLFICMIWVSLGLAVLVGPYLARFV